MEHMDMNVFRDDILSTIKESLLVLDADLNVIYANTPFYEVFHTTPKETLHRRIYELGSGQWNIPELRELLERVLPEKHAIGDFRGRYIFPFIGEKSVLLRAKELKDSARKEKYVLLTIEDITEETQLLEATLQTNKLAMIGQLSAGIAHGLSSPLTGIHNFLSVYNKEEPKGNRKEEYKLMLEACEYMNKIVKNLLFFARTTKEATQKNNWKDIIDSTLSFTERQFTAVNIFITIDLPSDIKSIYGHKCQLQHVLLNILMNAKEAMHADGGTITIKARNTEKDEVILEVTDDGRGISQEDLPRIFEPFFTTKKTKEGAGLGLSAAYGIIKDHHGTITIKSEEGKGTRVLITLPTKKVKL